MAAVPAPMGWWPLPDTPMLDCSGPAEAVGAPISVVAPEVMRELPDSKDAFPPTIVCVRVTADVTQMEVVFQEVHKVEVPQEPVSTWDSVAI